MSELTPLSGLVPTPEMRLDQQESARLREAAADFEAMFLKQMLTSMRKAIPKDTEGALFKESEGEKIFRDLLDEEYARVMSRGGNSLGLKESMLNHLTGSAEDSNLKK